MAAASGCFTGVTAFFRFRMPLRHPAFRRATGRIRPAYDAMVRGQVRAYRARGGSETRNRASTDPWQTKDSPFSDFTYYATGIVSHTDNADPAFSLIWCGPERTALPARGYQRGRAPGVHMLSARHTAVSSTTWRMWCASSPPATPTPSAGTGPSVYPMTYPLSGQHWA